MAEDELPPITPDGSGELPSLTAEPPLPTGTRLGDFEVQGLVGRGGMGTVYRALQHSLRRVVALKVLRPAIANDPAAVERFHREAILAASLKHPNIVSVFYVEKDAKPPFLAMDYVPGRSLEEKVKAVKRLPPGEAVRIVLQACEALEHAHERHVIHRDIKPGNILLENHLEWVRITDFGIAQDVTGRLAEMTKAEGATAGTLEFMSPEQNLGHRADKQSDIFSLGATLYYVLTGRPAYPARNQAELALAFQAKPPVSPSSLNPQVSLALENIVLKMIAVAPKARYASCQAVAADLRSLDAEGDLSQSGAAMPKLGATRLLGIGLAALAALLVIAILLPTIVGSLGRGPATQPAVPWPVVPPPGPSVIVMKSGLHPSPFRQNSISRPLLIAGDFCVAAWVMVDSLGRTSACPPTVGGLQLVFDDGRQVAVRIANGCFSFTTEPEDTAGVPAKPYTWYCYQIVRVGSRVACRVLDVRGNEMARRELPFGRGNVKTIRLLSYNAAGGQTCWGGIRTPKFIDSCNDFHAWIQDVDADSEVDPAGTCVRWTRDILGAVWWPPLWQEDFENRVAGESPSPWEDLTGSNEAVVTTDWAATGKKSLASITSDPTWLKRPVVNMKKLGMAALPDHLRCQCVLRLEAPSSSALVGFLFRNPKFGNQFPSANAVVFQSDGKVTWSGPAVDGAGLSQPSSREIGTWSPGKEVTFKVRVEFDFAGGRADVWLDGKPLAEDLPAWRRSIPASSSYGAEVPLEYWGFGLAGNLWSGKAAGRVLIDDVQFSGR